MGQEEIIELLKKESKALSRTEIAELLDVSPIRVSAIIQRIFNDPTNDEIDFIEIDRKVAMKRYNTKHKMKIYYYRVIRK